MHCAMLRYLWDLSALPTSPNKHFFLLPDSFFMSSSFLPLELRLIRSSSSSNRFFVIAESWLLDSSLGVQSPPHPVPNAAPRPSLLAAHAHLHPHPSEVFQLLPLPLLLPLLPLQHPTRCQGSAENSSSPCSLVAQSLCESTVNPQRKVVPLLVATTETTASLVAQIRS